MFKLLYCEIYTSHNTSSNLNLNFLDLLAPKHDIKLISLIDCFYFISSVLLEIDTDFLSKVLLFEFEWYKKYKWNSLRISLFMVDVFSSNE